MKITVELSEEYSKRMEHILKSYVDTPSLTGMVEMYIEDGIDNTLDNLHDMSEEDGLSEYGIINN